MTTESVQKRYINDNTNEKPKAHSGKDKPSKLDTDLEIFALREEKDGVKPSTIKTHGCMVRTALKVISEKRKISDHRRITKADLTFVQQTLTERHYSSPVSYARVLAKFVSTVTGNEPLIPLGSLQRKIRNEYLLTTPPDGDRPRRTMGTAEDRMRIESEFGEHITAFHEHLMKSDMNCSTGTKIRKTTCAAIFAFEQSCGKLDPGAVTEGDLDRMKAFLDDFGTSDASRLVNQLVRFIANVTGNPPMREIQSGCPRKDWREGMEEYFPFKRELVAYGKLLDSRDVQERYRKRCIKETAVFGGLLNVRYSVTRLADVKPEMLDSIREEIGKYTTSTSALHFVKSFANFASYFGRDDLRDHVKFRDGRTPYIATDESDMAFKTKLEGWEGFMTKWEYSPHTIKSRLASVKVCYGHLKAVKGPFELESLEDFDIQVLRNTFIGYCESTVQAYLYAFGWFLDYAIGRNLFAESHIWFNGIEIRRNFVSMDEFARLWDVGGPLEHMILALEGSMGIRRAEMIGLKVSDFGDTLVKVRGKGAGAEGKVVKMETTELVRDALKEYLPFREALLNRYGDRSDGSLLVNPFIREIGRPLSPRSFQTILEKLSEDSGVSFTSHGLRRMYAMNLSDAGVELDTIRRMMRHADLETTLKCYLHADPRKMTGAVGKLNSAFSTLNLNSGKKD